MSGWFVPMSIITGNHSIAPALKDFRWRWSVLQSAARLWRNES
jgi:hypothetical protein